MFLFKSFQNMFLEFFHCFCLISHGWSFHIFSLSTMSIHILTRGMRTSFSKHFQNPICKITFLKRTIWRTFLIPVRDTLVWNYNPVTLQGRYLILERDFQKFQPSTCIETTKKESFPILKFLLYLFQFLVQKWIKQITRQDRYLQYFGRGFFFSEDSQLFGRDSFGGNTVGTQIAHTSPKWVPFTHQALYIRKLFPLNETGNLVVTIFWKNV